MDFATIESKVHAAEELGFDSAWFMDHIAPPMARQHDCFEAWTLVSALAARTTKIRLGHLVLCGPFRHPVILAKMAATVDVISGGRLELGIGWGSLADELRDYGFGDEQATARAARLAETLEILELLFTGEPIDYTGRYYRLEGAVCRPRPFNARLAVHLGGAGKTLTMPLVRRFADWWNCPSYAVAHLDELKPLAGDRARISVQHPIGLVPSSASRDDVIDQAERRFGSWGGLIAGTPTEVADALRAEVALGVELFILQFSDFGQQETLELFAKEVMPALELAKT